MEYCKLSTDSLNLMNLPDLEFCNYITKRERERKRVETNKIV